MTKMTENEGERATAMDAGLRLSDGTEVRSFGDLDQYFGERGLDFSDHAEALVVQGDVVWYAVELPEGGWAYADFYASVELYEYRDLAVGCAFGGWGEIWDGIAAEYEAYLEAGRPEGEAPDLRGPVWIGPETEEYLKWRSSVPTALLEAHDRRDR